MRSWRITIIAPTPHEKPETTACGTLATYRPSRSTQKIIMKTDAARQTLAAPPIPWAAHGGRDERHGGAGRAADQDGIAAQERRDRRGQDRGEQAQLGRQSHQPRQGQSVGERDQGGDRAAQCVARQVVPAVARSCCAAAPAAWDGSDIHDALEGRPELRHLVTGADRDPHVIRHRRPGPADDDLLLEHAPGRPRGRACGRRP